MTGLGTKGSGELSRTQMRDAGKLLDRQAPAKILSGIGERALNSVRLRIEIEQCRELRLPTGATVEDHDCLRGLSSEICTQVLLDQGESEIDACGHTCRRPD